MALGAGRSTCCCALRDDHGAMLGVGLAACALSHYSFQVEVHVNFPRSDATFPGGAEADAINNNCLICHSAGMVLDQASLPRAAWQVEVDKMHNDFKAPFAAGDAHPRQSRAAALRDNNPIAAAMVPLAMATADMATDFLLLFFMVQATVSCTRSITLRMKPPPFQFGSAGWTSPFVLVQRTCKDSVPDWGAVICVLHWRKL